MFTSLLFFRLYARTIVFVECYGVRSLSLDAQISSQKEREREYLGKSMDFVEDGVSMHTGEKRGAEQRLCEWKWRRRKSLTFGG